MSKKILYLFSDTGGGHRASANSLIAAVNKINPKIQQEMIDVFTECGGLLNFIVKLYGPIVKYSPWLWRYLYYFADQSGGMSFIEKITFPYVAKVLAEQIRILDPDIIVSVHPLLNRVTIKALDQLKRTTPFITVVTDPVTLHNSWISNRADAVVVATEDARDMAVSYGMPKGKIKILGLPIHPKFLERKNKKEILKSFGLQENLTTILLMGGGEGGGNMEKILASLDKNPSGIQAIVICGRNEKLVKQLEKDDFNFPKKIFGFTTEVPLIMDAADLIITKGGPGSIAEAMAKDLPMVISSWLPGQEEGNVKYVKQHDLGFVEKNPDRIASIIKKMLKSKKLGQIRHNINKVAHPNASMDIAKFILNHLK